MQQFDRQNPPQKSPGRVVIIDYEFGNVRSVRNALEALGAEVKISREEADLRAADSLILPGVGAFRDGMANLRRLELIPLLNELVHEHKKPFLGICVGMQLLARKGYEYGEYDGLGWLDAEVVRFEVDKSHDLKVPHVGWNDVKTVMGSPILGDAGEIRSFYFVHSYYLRCNDPGNVVGICDYGIEFPAVLQKDNIFAAQFHPEKSLKHGLKLLADFMATVQSPATVSEAAC